MKFYSIVGKSSLSKNTFDQNRIYAALQYGLNKKYSHSKLGLLK